MHLSSLHVSPFAPETHQRVRSGQTQWKYWSRNNFSSDFVTLNRSCLFVDDDSLMNFLSQFVRQSRTLIHDFLLLNIHAKRRIITKWLCVINWLIAPTTTRLHEWKQTRRRSCVHQRGKQTLEIEDCRNAHVFIAHVMTREIRCDVKRCNVMSQELFHLFLSFFLSSSLLRLDFRFSCKNHENFSRWVCLLPHEKRLWDFSAAETLNENCRRWSDKEIFLRGCLHLHCLREHLAESNTRQTLVILSHKQSSIQQMLQWRKFTTVT